MITVIVGVDGHHTPWHPDNLISFRPDFTVSRSILPFLVAEKIQGLSPWKIKTSLCPFHPKPWALSCDSSGIVWDIFSLLTFADERWTSSTSTSLPNTSNECTAIKLRKRLRRGEFMWFCYFGGMKLQLQPDGALPWLQLQQIFQSTHWSFLTEPKQALFQLLSMSWKSKIQLLGQRGPFSRMTQ